MNRRDFIKSIGVITAGSAAIAVPQLIADKVTQEKRTPEISFDEGTLKRYFSGNWVLDFSSSKRFDLREKSGNAPQELVVEIGDYMFLLKQPRQIDFATAEYTRSGKIYLHHIEGDGWEQL